MSDDCVVKHPPLTELDDASMLAAYSASYIGIYGHEPSMLPGSGTQDGHYWISVSNHFGMFSDSVCRAGWSRYWEVKLAGGDSADPKLGDLPALFQPRKHPSLIFPPAPPVPAPSVGGDVPQMRVLTEDELNRSLAPVTAALVTLQAAVDELRARKPEAIMFPDYDLRLPFGSRGLATKKVQ